MNKYFKVFGLSVDENGEKDFAGIKVNEDIKERDIASILNVDVSLVTEITQEEYETDYGE